MDVFLFICLIVASSWFKIQFSVDLHHLSLLLVVLSSSEEYDLWSVTVSVGFLKRSNWCLFTSLSHKNCLGLTRININMKKKRKSPLVLCLTSAKNGKLRHLPCFYLHCCNMEILTWPKKFHTEFNKYTIKARPLKSDEDIITQNFKKNAIYWKMR